jgi:hypothetical protein
MKRTPAIKLPPTSKRKTARQIEREMSTLGICVFTPGRSRKSWHTESFPLVSTNPIQKPI